MPDSVLCSDGQTQRGILKKSSLISQQGRMKKQSLGQQQQKVMINEQMTSRIYFKTEPDIVEHNEPTLKEIQLEKHALRPSQRFMKICHATSGSQITQTTGNYQEPKSNVSANVHDLIETTLISALGNKRKMKSNKQCCVLM